MSAMSPMLVIAGGICLALTGFIMHKLRPRDGQTPSAWVNSDTKATTLAVSLLALFLAGVSLVVKGLF
jgi:hypothetical protein